MLPEAYEILKKKYGAVKGPTGRSKGHALIWTLVSGALSVLEHDIYVSLLLRKTGYDTTMVLCDGSLPICLLYNAPQNPYPRPNNNMCRNCQRMGRELCESVGSRYVFLGDLVAPERMKQECKAFDGLDMQGFQDIEWGGVAVGTLAVSSAVRYFRVPAENALFPENEKILRKYLQSALICFEAARNAIDRLAPDMLFMSHGLYVEWGSAFTLAQAAGLPVARVQNGMIGKSLHLRRNAPDDHKVPMHLSSAEWDALCEKGLRRDEARELDALLDEYSKGEMTRERYFDADSETSSKLSERLGLPTDKPIWGIFTHLVWDAHLFDCMAHDTMRAWLEDTFRIILGNTDVHWVIKVHPSEDINYTSHGALDVLRDILGDNLPDHITLIQPDDRLNNLELQKFLSGGVTIRGTAGLELALQGKPVILTGECHYGGKGFTLDCLDLESYRETLRKAADIPELTGEQRELARLYAHSFFCRRHIPVLPDIVRSSGEAGKEEGPEMDLRWVVEQLTGSCDPDSRCVTRIREK